MITMTSLLERCARAGDRRMRIDEVFFHERTGHIRYLALRTGGAFRHEDVLVAAGRFEPLRDEGDWPLTLSEDDIEAAPHWDNGEEEADIPLALEYWPPILIGPFGSTTSPLLFYAALSESERRLAASEAPAAADPRVARLERATRRLGGEVFGSDGSLGNLADLELDAQTLSIQAFRVGDPPRLVPYSALRHMADDARHTVLNLDRTAFEALPEA